MSASAPKTLRDLTERVRDLADRPFVADAHRSLSGEEAADEIDALVDQLLIAGVNPGDRVLGYLPHGVEQALFPFAVAEVGGVAVLANSRSRLEQIVHLVEDAEPAAVVTDRDLLGSLAAPESPFGDAPLLIGPFEPIGLEQRARVEPGDLAILLYTSGSTGRPKGVMQSHRSVVDGARIVSGYLGLRESDHLAGVLPLSFDYGLNQVLGAAFVGATVTLRPFLAGPDLVNALAEIGATVLAGVPELHAAVVDALESGALPDLRLVTNSGGRLSKRIIERYLELLPRAELFSMYGLTEAFRSSFVPPEVLRTHEGTVGRAMPDVELFVVDPETGVPVGPGVGGELVHAGACIAAGYWRRPGETAERFRSDPRGGEELVVFTGDRAEIDADGFVTLRGRADAQIKVQGQRVSPDEVTAVVAAVPGVRNAAALGVPRGEDGLSSLCVVVVCDDGVAEGIDRAVRVACRRRLPPHMVPREVHRVDALPLTPNHKVDQVALREFVLKQAPDQ